MTTKKIISSDQVSSLPGYSKVDEVQFSELATVRGTTGNNCADATDEKLFYGNSNTPDFSQKMEYALRLFESSLKTLKKLQDIDPFLIDLSLRENPVGDRIGQTLKQKLEILPQLRQFGFKNILLGTLDYAIADELEVDDDFLMYLRDNQIDMTGGYVFTAIGLVDKDERFTPDSSMLKMQAYGVPNTLHEIYLSKAGRGGVYDIDTLRRSVVASIQWLNEHIRGDHGGKPNIFINIVDGFDAMFEDLQLACTIFALLAQQDIAGISIEDDRGTYLPSQVGTLVAIVRTFLPPPMKILVHVHSGGGYENASALEALMHGADGVWGAIPKSAAVIGHASLGELIANLVRVGNATMDETYQLQQLIPLATQLQVMDQRENVPDDYPILGNNAYRLNLTSFEQINGRFMDLPPEKIGATYRYRICPVVSDTPIIAGRLSEVTGLSPDEFPQSVLLGMIRLMRQDLRDGKRIVYDNPKNLLALYERALQCISRGVKD